MANSTMKPYIQHLSGTPFDQFDEDFKEAIRRHARMMLDLLGEPATPVPIAAADPMLTRQEAADYAHRTPECIRLWCRQGLGRFDRTAQRWLIPTSQLQEWVRRKADRLKKRQ